MTICTLFISKCNVYDHKNTGWYIVLYSDDYAIMLRLNYVYGAKFQAGIMTLIITEPKHALSSTTMAIKKF